MAFFIASSMQNIHLFLSLQWKQCALGI